MFATIQFWTFFPHIGCLKVIQIKYHLLSCMRVKTLFHMFKEQRLRVSENRAPGKIFLTKWQIATGNRDNCTMRSNSIIVFSSSHIFLGWPGRLRWVWNVAHIGSTRIYTKSGQKTLRTVVPKVWSADPKGSVTSSQRINEYIPVMDTLNYSHFLN